MANLTIVGIDPGVVHTGIVVLTFHTDDGAFSVDTKVFTNVPAKEIADFVTGFAPHSVFIEDYDPRSHFNNDTHMIRAVGALQQELPKAVRIDNAGVKTLIRPALMQLLEVWKFQTPTNHDDLRSAARILLFGMFKDKKHGYKEILNTVVRAHLKGDDWNVRTKTEH